MREDSASVKSHKDLHVWKNSVALAVRLYEASSGFPQAKQYGLTSQMRRAAVSIGSNMAEGAARKTAKDCIHFLHISLGSAHELETQLEIASQVDSVIH